MIAAGKVGEGCEGVGEGWARDGQGGERRVSKGWDITPFNIYISDVKKFTSKMVFPLLQLRKFLVEIFYYVCVCTHKKEKRPDIHY